MSFSQRYGYKPIRETIQYESMDIDLRNSLWNALWQYYLNEWESESKSIETVYYGRYDNFFIQIWVSHLKKPIDTISDSWDRNFLELRNHFFRCPWYEVYDFIEFMAQLDYDNTDKFIIYCNYILEREKSAYRFVDKYITEITSENEITEIEDAISNTSTLKTVQQHLQTALALMADKKQPDYRNSIKEAISAVESLCRLITQNQNATLGQALNHIEKIGQVELHTALKEAYSKLYGYTNDADGIRHALKDQSNVAIEDAKYMLVSCSAFINYLIAKTAKAGIKIS